jgi:hypothetical protein
MPVNPGASSELPTGADGEVDWVLVASMQSFPASDAPAYPSSAEATGPHVPDERSTQ